MTRSKPPRKTARWDPMNQFYGGGKIFIELRGSMVLAMAKYYQPSKESIRDNILELRTKLHWTQTYSAAVFGIPLTTLRSWEDGTRTPSGAARKLIWLIWRLFIQQEVTTHRDIADWGQELGSVRVDQIGAMIEQLHKLGELETDVPV